MNYSGAFQSTTNSVFNFQNFLLLNGKAIFFRIFEKRSPSRGLSKFSKIEYVNFDLCLSILRSEFPEFSKIQSYFPFPTVSANFS